jgi:quercetin dioxygenase-like cupin family protein
MSAQHLDGIAARLARRARASVAAHREFRTVRREDRPFSAVAPGCEEALLRNDAGARVALLRLAPGAELPWAAGTTAQEILVVDGVLSVRPAGAKAQALPAQGLVLRQAASAASIAAADVPTLVYLRALTVAPPGLPAAEAHWWRLAAEPLVVVDPTRRRWRNSFPGVEVLPLWGDPSVTSMLVRFAPGASVPDHRHAIDEDCLMLDGEMFLGDILLRPGDYQLAPAGGGHVGECSDVGGLFFFHGAIDPVLVPAR